MEKIYFSRTYSLPPGFFKKNCKLKKDGLEKLKNVFDNNRFLSRKRVYFYEDILFINARIFDQEVSVNTCFLVHSSDNVSIVCEIECKEEISSRQASIVKENWIPEEDIVVACDEGFNSRDLLNLSFYSFLKKFTYIGSYYQPVDFYKKNKDLFLKETDDISVVKAIYEFFEFSYASFYYIPTMYGSLIVSKNMGLCEKFSCESHHKLDVKFSLQRNFAFVLYDDLYKDKFAYLFFVFSFLNLVKHLRNRVGGEVSSMLDHEIDENYKNKYDHIENGFNIKSYMTKNYDELNNINIWHNDFNLFFSKKILSEDGWDLKNDIDSTSKKLEDYLSFVKSVSSDRMRLIVDTITLIVGLIGIFSVFELISVLNTSPLSKYSDWYVSFLAIFVLSPLVLIILAKYSRGFLKFLERFL